MKTHTVQYKPNYFGMRENRLNSLLKKGVVTCDAGINGLFYICGAVVCTAAG